jgi:hypothetical protein
MGIFGRCGHDCMVVGFTTTYAISIYHHYHCEFEFHSGDTLYDKVFSDLWQVGGFLQALRLPPPIKLNATI